MLSQVICAADFVAECRNDSTIHEFSIQQKEVEKRGENKRDRAILSKNPNVHVMIGKTGEIMQSITTALIAISVKARA